MMKRNILGALALAVVCAQGAPHVIEVKPGGSLEAARDAFRSARIFPASAAVSP